MIMTFSVPWSYFSTLLFYRWCRSQVKIKSSTLGYHDIVDQKSAISYGL